MQDVFEPVLEAVLREQPRWASHGTPAPGLILEIAASGGLDVEAARREAQPTVTLQAAALTEGSLSKLLSVGIFVALPAVIGLAAKVALFVGELLLFGFISWRTRVALRAFQLAVGCSQGET